MTVMKVAVTGASGFIGRRVLVELSRHSVEVTAVARNAAKLSDIAGKVRVVEMDIADVCADDYGRLNKPDVLIHLAWDGLPNYGSLHHIETELPRQFRFLKAMVEAGLPSLLVTGTCFEYGMQSGSLSEDMTARPANPYGYAKDALRRQLEFLQEIKPFDLTWARLFYIYGEGQSKSSLYSQLREAVSCGDQVFNMSGGKQLRDYLPISEVAQKIARLATAGGGNIGIVNVCSGKPVSVRELVEGWLKDNGWAIKLNAGYYPYPDYEPMAFWGNSQKLETLLT